MEKETKSLLNEWVKEIPSIVMHNSMDITHSEKYGYGLQLQNYKGEFIEETPVLTIPNDLVICASRISDLAIKDKILQSWLDVDSCSGIDLLHRGLLYYWLFAESKWKPYLLSLPTDLDLPFNYSIKKMESLDFTTISLNYAAMSKRLQIERAYERFVMSNVKHSKSITLTQWLLPYQWISSRGLKHPVRDETCVVPLVDLCNHSSYESNVRYDLDEHGNIQLLLLPLAPKELRVENHKSALFENSSVDLLLNYGIRSSTEFMFNYGFIPEDRTEDDFDEIIRFFDPSSDEIRNILDPGRAVESASDDERFAWSLAYDVLLEFFSDNIPQILRIVVLPRSIEPNDHNRFRFHNHFVMALASDEHLELITENDVDELYLDNVKLMPDRVFETVQSLHDKKILQKARELVAKLCRSFYDSLTKVSESDASISNLSKVEASIYKRYADVVEARESLYNDESADGVHSAKDELITKSTDPIGS